MGRRPVAVLGPSGGNRFSPSNVSIQAGETVEWVWPPGAMGHTVAQDTQEPASSGALSNGPKTSR